MTHLMGELSYGFPALPDQSQIFLPPLRGVQGCVTFAEKYPGSSYKLEPADMTFELLFFCSFELLLISRSDTALPILKL